MSHIIAVKNLTKRYGKLLAVDSVSFEVTKGEIFGLLGPNGAGKTTTMEMIQGLKKPESGSVAVLGKDIATNSRSLLDLVGVVPQHAGFLPNLTIEELLELFASFYRDCEPIESIAQKFSLNSILDRYYDQLSGGQKQRFILAVALLHRPKVVYLDEPTIGLDPQIRQNFWDIILNLRRDGLTILLTTHYMEEAQLLCDRVGIIDHGRLLVVDRPVKLINSLGVVSRVSFMSSKPINVAELEHLQGVRTARRDRYFYDIETEEPENTLRNLLEWEKSNFTGKIFSLQVHQATLEDVFLKLTGRSLRE